MTDVDRSRFTNTEWALFTSGKCCYQTGYGLPWMTWCEKPSQDRHPLGYCAEHAAEVSA